MKKIAILALFLMGCGDPEVYPGLRDLSPKPLIEYKADCLTVYSQFEANPTVIRDNVLLAREMMTPIVGDFCGRFSNTYIVMVDKYAWKAEDGSDVIGSYTTLEGMRLDHYMLSLTHELFHVMDAQDFRVDSTFHAGWDTNGRNALNDQYDLEHNSDVKLVW